VAKLGCKYLTLMLLERIALHRIQQQSMFSPHSKGPHHRINTQKINTTSSIPPKVFQTILQSAKIQESTEQTHAARTQTSLLTQTYQKEPSRNRTPVPVRKQKNRGQHYRYSCCLCGWRPATLSLTSSVTTRPPGSVSVEVSTLRGVGFLGGI
jgi:hypothetical protein